VSCEVVHIVIKIQSPSASVSQRISVVLQKVSTHPTVIPTLPDPVSGTSHTSLSMKAPGNLHIWGDFCCPFHARLNYRQLRADIWKKRQGPPSPGTRPPASACTAPRTAAAQGGVSSS
jgi:hypothetical protein